MAPDIIGFIRALVDNHQVQDVSTPVSANRRPPPRKSPRQRLEDDRRLIMISQGVVLPIYDKQEKARRKLLQDQEADKGIKQRQFRHFNNAVYCAAGMAVFVAVIKLT